MKSPLEVLKDIDTQLQELIAPEQRIPDSLRISILATQLLTLTTLIATKFAADKPAPASKKDVPPPAPKAEVPPAPEPTK